jgi:hypothetical protein
MKWLPRSALKSNPKWTGPTKERATEVCYQLGNANSRPLADCRERQISGSQLALFIGSMDRRSTARGEAYAGSIESIFATAQASRTPAIGTPSASPSTTRNSFDHSMFRSKKRSALYDSPRYYSNRERRSCFSLPTTSQRNSPCQKKTTTRPS